MARLQTTLIMHAYRAATWLATPLASLLLARRLQRGKEDGERLAERRGIASVARPAGPLVWLHGASVGEVLAVTTLIDQLRARGFRVLLTSGTVTSARLAQSRLPPDVIHQFVPLDSPVFVRRFLRHWRPDLVLLAESELWPNILAEVNARRTPLVLVNARMSRRSFERWRRIPRSAAALLSRIDLCLAQGEPDGEHLRTLGAPRVMVTGNLKFDTPPPPADIVAFDALRTATLNRPILIAASTHPGEEEAVLEAHRRLAATLPSLLTIIAPRHPERGEQVEALAAERGLTSVRRSQDQLPDADTALYVMDTIGELGLCYRLGPVAFLGGSLIRHGGQNPIEPVRLDACILHGPHVSNFAEIYARLDEAGGAVPVADAAALAEQAGILLADIGRRQSMIAAAQAVLDGFGGALGHTLSAIDPYLVQIRLEKR